MLEAGGPLAGRDMPYLQNARELEGKVRDESPGPARRRVKASLCAAIQSFCSQQLTLSLRGERTRAAASRLYRGGHENVSAIPCFPPGEPAFVSPAGTAANRFITLWHR